MRANAMRAPPEKPSRPTLCRLRVVGASCADADGAAPSSAGRSAFAVGVGQGPERPLERCAGVREAGTCHRRSEHPGWTASDQTLSRLLMTRRRSMALAKVFRDDAKLLKCLGHSIRLFASFLVHPVEV